MTWLFDLSNALVSILTIVIAYRIKITPAWISLVLSAYSFIPFFLNDFLLPPRYMGDQYLYYSILQEVRHLNIFSHNDTKPLVTAWILSILPVPFVETIKSLGFFNRYLFLIVFLWLYSKKFLNGGNLYFLLFYPSLVFYTSLSLRDPLVMILMILSVIFLIEKKYIFSFAVSIPLYFIKFQNFYFILIIYFLWIIFGVRKNKILILSFLISFLFIFLFLFLDTIIASVDFYREALYKENGGNVADYVRLQGISDLVLKGIISFPYFLFKPFPWEAENFFQIVQSYENIFVTLFLIIFTIKSYFENKMITLKWLIFFIFVITIYGITVFNFGTASRYRFPIIVVYVIGLSYDLFKTKGFQFKEILKSK